MDQDAAVVIVIGGISLLVLLFLLLSSPESGKVSRRLKKLDSGSSPGNTGRRDGDPSRARERRKKLLDSLSRADDIAGQRRKNSRVPLKLRFERANLDITSQVYYIFSGVTGLFFASLAFLAGLGVAICAGVLLVAGTGLPRFMLFFLSRRRQGAFLKGFPDSIDIIVRGVKSGLPLNECFQIVVRDAPPPVSDEFFVLTEGLQMGVTMEQSLEKMYRRIPLPEVSFFGTVLSLQRKTGGNLGEALGNLSGILRSRKLLEGKVKALSAEAKMSATILGVLPFVIIGVLYFMNPGYLLPLFKTPAGNLLLIAGVFWMSIGIVIIAKMAQIKA